MSAESSPLAVVLPLSAAFLYTVGALYLKRGMSVGAGVLRIAVLGNWAIALALWALWPLADGPPTWDPWWAPLVCGTLFFAGNALTFLAIRVGDVSVQSPIMGTKTIFVALVVAFFGQVPIAGKIWLAAAISAVGVFLLGYRPGLAGARVRRGALLAVASALAFGSADASLQLLSPSFGGLTLAVLMMQVCALLSFLIIPFFNGPFHAIPRSAWPWAGLGIGFTAFQATLMGFTIVTYQQVTQANILYSSRGIWSVLLVWVAGQLFANTEASAGRGILVRRVIGAVLMTLAIMLAV